MMSCNTVKYRVTDEWFDNDNPNPLVPKGIVIDPVKRRVEITNYFYVGDTFYVEKEKQK